MNEERILIDEIKKHMELTARILVSLATVGIASDGQLLRFCTTLSHADRYLLHLADSKEDRYREVFKEAGRMLKTESYLGREMNVRLPKYMGGGLTNVWYLTARGVAAARIIDPYFVRFACEGLPCGTKKDRIPHELAVTESFLRLTEKLVVCDFIPERELKSRLMKRRHELRRQGINPNWHPETTGEETGDFRALLLSKDGEGGRKFQIEGEAAINYRRAQIEAKPANMVWFVTSKVQKEMVIATKKDQVQDVLILKNVCEPLAPKGESAGTGKEIKGGRRRNKLERKLVGFMRIRNETFTVKGLAGILNEHTQHVSSMLQRLNEIGIVMSEEAKLTPAKHRGRPNKLYWFAENNDKIDHTRAARVRAIVLCEVVDYLVRNNYRFRHYSEAARQADFIPLDATKFAPVYVVIESPDLSEIQLKEKITTANNSVRNTKTGVIIAVSTVERYEEIKEICSANFVYLVENKCIIKPIAAAIN